MTGGLFPYGFADADLRRFYAAKWKLRHCEICEVSNFVVDAKDHLSLIAASDGGLAANPFDNGREAGALFSNSQTVHLRIICNNCGNTKFLLASVIRRWLAENP